MRQTSNWMSLRQSKRVIFALVLFICACGFFLSSKSTGYNEVAAKVPVNEVNRETVQRKDIPQANESKWKPKIDDDPESVLVEVKPEASIEFEISSEIEAEKVNPSVSKTIQPSSKLFKEEQIDEKRKSDCSCVSKKTGRSHNFCYVDPQNLTSIGLKFNCDHLPILENLNLVDNTGPFADLYDTEKNSKEVVFVSAISENHYSEGSHSIGEFYKHTPGRKFILYSLGMSDHYINKIKKEFQYLEVRVFNTSRYPDYVTRWMEYRFKPLIIAEVMKEYSNIWWIDAHIVVTKPKMIELFYEEMAERLAKNDTEIPIPLYFFIHTSHGNFPTLFPEVLTYFPSNSDELLKDEKKGAQVGANTFFVARTEYAIEIFKWWILCALDKTCMAPQGAQVYCRFKPDRFKEFANCFRFDQSVLNVLVLNSFQDHNKYLTTLCSLFLGKCLD